MTNVTSIKSKLSGSVLDKKGMLHIKGGNGDGSGGTGTGTGGGTPPPPVDW